MKTPAEIIHRIKELVVLSIDTLMKGQVSEAKQIELDQITAELVFSFTQWGEALELIERVMTEHWDMASCPCAFCWKGRELGLKPQAKLYANPPLSILKHHHDSYVWKERPR